MILNLVQIMVIYFAGVELKGHRSRGRSTSSIVLFEPTGDDDDDGTFISTFSQFQSILSAHYRKLVTPAA